METKDYYRVLGVKPKATESQIRRAYLDLAKKFHPDRNPGDKKAELRFKEINEAYEILADEKKRARYDRVRSLHRFGFNFDGFGKNKGDPFGGFDLGDINLEELKKAFKEQFGGKGAGGIGGLGGLGDMFDSFFRKKPAPGESARETAKPSVGEDIHFNITVSDTTALEGGRVPVTLPSEEACSACKGTGERGGEAAQACPDCKGKGQVSVSQGGFAISRPCPKCLGRGKQVTKPCAECGGAGVLERERTIRVKIPPNLESGKEIRVPGQGHPGPEGGKAGDLYLKVFVRPSPEREAAKKTGLDGAVEVSVVLNLAQAVLGTTMPFVTPSGDTVRLRIPAGAQPGHKLRLRGKGQGGADLIVRVQLEIPKDLTEAQQRRFEAFAREARLTW